MSRKRTCVELVEGENDVNIVCSKRKCNAKAIPNNEESIECSSTQTKNKQTKSRSVVR